MGRYSRLRVVGVMLAALSSHKGIYIGQGRMIDEPNSDSHLRIDVIKGFAPGKVIKYRLPKH